MLTIRRGYTLSQEDRLAAEAKINSVVKKLRVLKLNKASKLVEQGAFETLSYYAFSSQHWRSLRTNNPLERLMCEIRRRTRFVGAFGRPISGDAGSGKIKACAGTKWGTRRYMNMDRLKELERQIA